MARTIGLTIKVNKDKKTNKEDKVNKDKKKED